MNSIVEKKKIWTDFYDRKGEYKHLFMIDYLPDNVPVPHLWPEYREARLDWAYDKYCKMQERSMWLNDHTIPYLDILTGTEIFAEAMGCKVFRSEENLPFALPYVKDSKEAAKVKVPKVTDSSLYYLFEMGCKLREMTGKDALVKIIDVQSPMDISALIWDKNYFFIAMIDEPEAVKELALKVKEFLFEFLDMWFAEFGTDFIAHYPYYYMPKGISVSEDEVGAISADMYKEFFEHELMEMSSRYGGMGMHCCANSYHQWENFKNIPDLKLLNLVQPVEILTEGYDFFKSHTAQMHSWYGTGQPWEWPASLPDECRLVISAYADTKERALILSEKLEQVCRK